MVATVLKGLAFGAAASFAFAAVRNKGFAFAATAFGTTFDLGAINLRAMG